MKEGGGVGIHHHMVVVVVCDRAVGEIIVFCCFTVIIVLVVVVLLLWMVGVSGEVGVVGEGKREVVGGVDVVVRDELGIGSR